MTEFFCECNGTVKFGDGETQVVRLEGPVISAAIVPASGGEAAGLSVVHKGRKIETLHRALDFTTHPGEWRGKAPFQWPAVGRNCVPEQMAAAKTPQDLMVGSWRCEGKRYPMPILGFLQYMEFETADMGADSRSAWVECRTAANSYSRQFYPFEFEINIRHEIAANRLSSTLRVRSLEKSRAMPFSIGNHITFRLPFTDDGRFEDCVFSSPTTGQMELNAQDLLSGRILPRDLRSGARLEDPALWNMVIGGYKRENAAVEIRDPASFGFLISQTEEPGDAAPTPDEFIHFVLYAERKFSSFCPEPWIGRPNSLNSGEGTISLPPGGIYTWRMDVEPLGVNP